MKTDEAARYYLKREGIGGEFEVTKQEFIQAERSAGFHSKTGPENCATGGFSGNGISGSVRYGEDKPANVRCACGDEFPPLSFGAGFMAANGGKCENCDSAEPNIPQEPAPRTKQLLCDAIDAALGSYHLHHVRQGDDEGYPLVDALTPPGAETIELGIDERALLGDHIYNYLLDLMQSLPRVLPELVEPYHVVRETKLMSDRPAWTFKGTVILYPTREQAQAAADQCNADRAKALYQQLKHAPICSTCQDNGEIGYTTGQTPESFDQGAYPCPDCRRAEYRVYTMEHRIPVAHYRTYPDGWAVIQQGTDSFSVHQGGRNGGIGATFSASDADQRMGHLVEFLRFLIDVQRKPEPNKGAIPPAVEMT